MTSPPPSLVVSCPRCAARFVLPPDLMGPYGARVRCPACDESFLVPAEGEKVARRVVRHLGSHELDAAAAEHIAEDVLNELEASAGPVLAGAKERGKLLSECGPLLLSAFDAFRTRAGSTADPAPFRRALRARYGIDLEPGA